MRQIYAQIRLSRFDGMEPPPGDFLSAIFIKWILCCFACHTGERRGFRPWSYKGSKKSKAGEQGNHRSQLNYVSQWTVSSNGKMSLSKSTPAER